MKSQNYISFITVCGFFIGVIFACCNIDDPWLFLGFVVFCTYAFYLLIHIVVINFTDAKKLGARPFEKHKIEHEINLICEALNHRENRIEKLRASVDQEISLIHRHGPKQYNRKPSNEAAA